MQTITFAQLFEKWRAPQTKDYRDWHPDDDAKLYRIRDGSLVLYIGISTRGVDIRLQEHLGLQCLGLSVVGRLVLGMAPESMSWSIDLFTPRELRIYIKPTYRNAMKMRGSDVIEIAEELMIAADHPCLNITINHKPTPLPDRYRLSDM